MACHYDDDLGERLLEEERKGLKTTIEALTKHSTPADIMPILAATAELSGAIERAYFVKRIAEQTGLPRRELMKDLTDLIASRNGGRPAVDANTVIAHPSYHVGPDFMALGFKETRIVDGEPTDVDLFVISTGEGYHYCSDTKTVRILDFTIVFDKRERVLITIGDRWSRERLVEFVENPEAPAGTFRRVKDVLKQYVELRSEAEYGMLSAWVLATYFHRLFHAVPFVFLFGKKQTGKTRLLDLLERLCFNAVKAKGISVASLADTLDGIRGTFLNDQAEALSTEKNQDILGIVADSYTVGGGRRRIVDLSNRKRRVVEFETYGPKAFASIKPIDDDILDRCIQLTTIRAEREYAYPESHLPEWAGIRDSLYRLLLTQWRRARDIYQTAGEGVTHRVRELWRPLETVLLLENVEAGEIQGIRAFFLSSMAETQSELSDYEIGLFRVLKEMLCDEAEKVLFIKDIAARLTPEGDMTRRGLETWVGKTVNQLNLHSGRVPRSSHGKAYRFRRDHIDEIYLRYTRNSYTGCEDAQTAADKASGGATSENTGCTEEAEVTQDTSSATSVQHPTNEDAPCNDLNNNDKCNTATGATEYGGSEDILAGNPKKVVRLMPGQKAVRVGRVTV